MYIVDGIAYAGEKTPAIKISGVRPMDDYKLWLRFNNGEAKVFDFAPMLEQPAFASLVDKGLFSQVYIDYGVTVWNDGDIDIAPKYLYDHSIPVSADIA